MTDLDRIAKAMYEAVTIAGYENPWDHVLTDRTTWRRAAVAGLTAAQEISEDSEKVIREMASQPPLKNTLATGKVMFKVALQAIIAAGTR